MDIRPVGPMTVADVAAAAGSCLAGPISEERLTGVSFDEQTGSDTDVVMAKEALGRFRRPS